MANDKTSVVLLVDDETSWHRLMHKAFFPRYVFENALDADQMWEQLEKKPFDLLILDLRLDGGQKNTGLELIPLLGKKYPHLPVVVATKENNTEVVVQALEHGAKNFLYKEHLDPKKWHEKFKGAITAGQAPRLQAEVARLQAAEDEKYQFIGKSTKIQDVQRMLREAALEPGLTILLTGETGVGKEVAARYFHRHGPRADKPFVGVNLSAIPHDLLESNLFGHVKGSFTGASKDTKGYFQQAHGGVLLLDEIGDIDLATQVKLLRVLQERVIQRVGDDKLTSIDVQIVAATHRDLAEAARRETFRFDLYQRIKTFTIRIPPLRERSDDIVLLLEHYLRFHLMGLTLHQVMIPEVLYRLLEYPWPGNIRELVGAIDYMLLRKRIGNKEQLDWECLPEDVRENRPLVMPGGAFDPERPVEGASSYIQIRPPAQSSPSKSRKEEQAQQDLSKIDKTLLQFEGNKTKVAETLGYKGTDHLRARIQTCHKNFPTLVAGFEQIRKHYDSLLK